VDKTQKWIKQDNCHAPYFEQMYIFRNTEIEGK
jgi:hypothetical protein